MDSTSVNLYAQGSIWHWVRVGEGRYEEGVQGAGRPVLIISNNIFNNSSPAVTCVTITTVLKSSPVHVAIQLKEPSHIQLEQIHTIPKTSLTRFQGMVTPAVLNEVKDRLKIQFHMREMHDVSILHDIKRMLEDIAADIRAGFRDSARDMNLLNAMTSISQNLASLRAEASLTQTSIEVKETALENVSGTVSVEPLSEKHDPQVPKEERRKLPRRKPSAEDLEYILNSKISAAEIIKEFGEKYDFKNPASVYNFRANHKLSGTRRL